MTIASLKKPWITNCWFATPKAASYSLVRAVSRSAAGSARETSMSVVRCRLASKRTVSWYNCCCACKPAIGPWLGVNVVLLATNPDQADSRIKRRSVCPVGTVAKITWSYVHLAEASPSRRANLSNAAISRVHEPEHCSSILAIAVSGRRPRSGQPSVHDTRPPPSRDSGSKRTGRVLRTPAWDGDSTRFSMLHPGSTLDGWIQAPRAGLHPPVARPANRRPMSYQRYPSPWEKIASRWV